MNVKAARTAYDADVPTTFPELCFRIKGLKQISTDPELFTLTGTPVAMAVDWTPILEQLQASMSNADAERLVNKLADTLWVDVMSQELAKRMARA